MCTIFCDSLYFHEFFFLFVNKCPQHLINRFGYNEFWLLNIDYRFRDTCLNKSLIVMKKISCWTCMSTLVSWIDNLVFFFKKFCYFKREQATLCFSFEETKCPEGSSIQDTRVQKLIFSLTGLNKFPIGPLLTNETQFWEVEKEIMWKKKYENNYSIFSIKTSVVIKLADKMKRTKFSLKSCHGKKINKTTNVSSKRH